MSTVTAAPSRRGRRARPGHLYLIRLAQPLGDPSRPRASAQRYLGFVACDAPIGAYKRLLEHRLGLGARMLAYAAEQGIRFDLVAIWPGTRDDERRLKRAGHLDRLETRRRGEGLWQTACQVELADDTPPF